MALTRVKGHIPKPLQYVLHTREQGYLVGRYSYRVACMKAHLFREHWPDDEVYVVNEKTGRAISEVIQLDATIGLVHREYRLTN